MAPDNGVLTGVFHEAAPKKVVELTERKYARPTVCRTFEGRDRFAPAAAWLAKGIQLPALGRPVSDYQVLALPRPKVEDGVLHGAVVRLDRFGNVVTNLDRKTCEKFGSGASTQVSIGGRTIARIVSTYSEIAVGELGRCLAAPIIWSSRRMLRARQKFSACTLVTPWPSNVHEGPPWQMTIFHSIFCAS